MNSDRTAILNGDKIEIGFEFDMKIIEAVRDIPGREWNKPAHPGVWIVPITPWHMAKVIETLQPFDFYVDPAITKGADKKAEKPKVKFPKGLYDYQKKGIEFIYATGGRCIIADDMGLGKTAESLVFMNQFCGKTLIITPASVLLKWATKECGMWAPDKKVDVIFTGKQEIDRSADITLMSYGIMVSKYQELQGIPYNCIIFDESHYIKAPKTQRTRMAKALVKAGIPHVLFLSGTPFMNRPSELFTALNMLDPKSYNNFYHYAARYCGWQYMGGMWVRPDKDVVTNASELADRLSHIMLRRTKRDVALELPDLTRSLVPVRIPNLSDYKQAKKDMQAWLKTQDMEVLDPNHVLTRLNVLRQIVGNGKTQAAIELAEDILESNDKVVLFAHHKEVVHDLLMGLKQYGVGIINGDTSIKERQRQIELFSHPTLTAQSQMRCMIISVAGAEGIDLYAASHIIVVERQWTPAKEEQAEARLHRIGQKNPVNAYYLVAVGTMDEKMNDVVENKRKMFGDVIRQDDIVSAVIDYLEEK